MPAHKLTPRRADIIVKMLSKGHYDNAAAKMAGVAASTLKQWLAKGREQKEGIYYELVKRVDAARDDGESFLVGKVVDAVDAGDWRAAAWILERKYHERWRKRHSTEVSGPNGAPLAVSPVTPEAVAEAMQKRLEAASNAPAADSLFD